MSTKEYVPIHERDYQNYIKLVDESPRIKAIVDDLLRCLDRIKEMAHNAPSNTPESELRWIETHATLGIKIAEDKMKGTP